MPALTARPFSTLVFSTRGLPAFIGTTVGATQGEEPPKRAVNPLEERHNIDFPQSSNPDMPAIIFLSSRAEFHIAEEEPDGPFQRLV